MTQPLLFSPLTLRGLTLRNRVVVSPMCQYKAVDGHMQDWHVSHHSRFALGGVGLAFVEATGVLPGGRITHGCTGIWDDAHVQGLKRIADLYRTHGVHSAIQIGHAGRRASAERPWDGAQPITRTSGREARWQTVGPSPIPEREGAPVPHELTAGEIGDIIEAFGAAARRSLKAGFDIIEVHGAHGYLVHSFVSPFTNKRTDAYGGTREKRMRFALEVAETVRSVWPEDRPVFYRASCVDGVEGGLVIEDTVALALALKARGIEVIDCSSGGMTGSPTLGTKKLQPGYQVPLAAAVRKGAHIKTMAVGAILYPRQAEDILAQGDADLIAIGREFIADPQWAYRAALELGVENPHAILPPSYGFYLERRAAILER